MKKYGLLGYTLSHSFSKKYFTEKFEKEHIEASYDNFDIAVLTDLKKNKFLSVLDGFNVTIPHKEGILDYLDEIDEVAQQIGAVNCVKNINGKWKGFNTDCIGFENSFLPFIEHAKPKKALVFGTGGASKSVYYVLQKHQIPFLKVSRAEVLNGITYNELTKELLKEYTILINATPIGMFPNIENKLPIPYPFLNNKHFVFDLIYNPSKTILLNYAEAQGASIKNGLEMLEMQAIESWKIWNKESK